MITVTSKIRRLPDLDYVAQDMRQLFGPDECQSGEVVVRKGQILSSEIGPLECVMAYCKDEGVLSIFLITKEDDGWNIAKGYARPSQTIKNAITFVLGKYPEELEF